MRDCAIDHSRPPLFRPADSRASPRAIVFGKRDQIIVWINITEQGIKQLDPRVPRFPAILDIGCNYNLLINEQHLTGWAGIQPGYLRQLVRMRVAGEPVSHLAANAWLYPNVPGKRDDLASLPPFLLELLPGIAVYPAKEGQPLYPRLPLLGLRAFRRAGLQIAIDCRRSRVTIRTPRRFWPFV